MRHVSFLVVLLLASSAQAVPLLLQQQGRLLDSSDRPLTGSRPIVFSIWDDETTGNLLWIETIDATFDNGYFSVVLGQTNPIDETVLDALGLWLGLTLAGEELLPRQQVVSAPYAIMAGTAENVVGGVVDAQSISIGGAPVVDETGAWVGSPVPDTLSGLTCNTGDVPAKSGAAWICVAGASLGTPLTEEQVENYVTNDSLDLAAGTTVGSFAISTGPHTTSLDWTAITNRPAGLDDGDDVGAGDISEIVTDPDGGLEGGTTAGSAALALRTCASGEVLKRTASAWECGSDDNDTYTAGAGEVLNGNTFSADPAALDDGSNLIPDSFFAYGMAYWEIGRGAGTVVTVSDGIGGNKVFANEANLEAWVFSKAIIPVDPNSGYEFVGSFRQNPDSPGGTVGVIYLAVRLYDANMANILGDGTWWYYPVSAAILTDTSWHSHRAMFGLGTGRPFPAIARFMTVGAILNYSGPTGGDRNYQVTGLGIYREATRVYRSQRPTGILTNGAVLPGAITFHATQGQQVTLMINYSGRPNAEGHTYLNMRLDGSLLGGIGAWSPSTWRRSFSAVYHAYIATTGSHTFTGVFECGSGTTQFSDAGTEWPAGGLAWTVIVGG